MHSTDDIAEGEGRDERIESALLLHVLMLHPTTLGEDELVTELAIDPIGREEVEAAVRSLTEVGLVARNRARVMPTRAAVRSYELWER
jgi:hypothetical protein